VKPSASVIQTLDRPVVGRVYPMSAAPRVFRMIESWRPPLPQAGDLVPLMPPRQPEGQALIGQSTISVFIDPESLR